MINSLDRVPVSRSCAWPCAVCKSGVGVYSFLCIIVYYWVNKRVSGVVNSLSNVILQCGQ